MGKKRDLSDFEHGTIVDARWAGLNYFCCDFPTQPSLRCVADVYNSQVYPNSRRLVKMSFGLMSLSFCCDTQMVV